LHVFRVTAGLLFLAWLLPFAGHVEDLFGLAGWFDRQGYAEAGRVIEDAPQQLSWSLLFLTGGDPLALRVVYWVSITVLAGFTLGLAPRLTALGSWAVVVSFSANPALEYDGDVFLTLLAFYLMLGFVLGAGKERGQSWLSWLLAPAWPLDRLSRAPRLAFRSNLGANLSLRLFQIHFAIVMVVTGLHKLQFGDWWAGLALWYPLVPPLETARLLDVQDTSWVGARALAGTPETLLFVLSAASYAVLAWQLAFPLFAWRPGWRPLLLGGAVLGWLGVALLYRLPLIGPALLVSCLAYLSPQEWRCWQDRVSRCWRFLREGARRASRVKEPVLRQSAPSGVQLPR
jgi:hypothetical protein